MHVIRLGVTFEVIVYIANLRNFLRRFRARSDLGRPEATAFRMRARRPYSALRALGRRAAPVPINGIYAPHSAVLSQRSSIREPVCSEKNRGQLFCDQPQKKKLVQFRISPILKKKY